MNIVMRDLFQIVKDILFQQFYRKVLLRYRCRLLLFCRTSVTLKPEVPVRKQSIDLINITTSVFCEIPSLCPR